jgi:glycine dehydrogenase subunit 1
MTASSPHPYIPNTDDDRRAMLDVIGAASADDLFADIPSGLRIDGLDLPPALSEQDLTREMAALAARNQLPGDGPSTGSGQGTACFLGGGAYRHFIPSVVGHVIGRSEFYTAYTPYQAEISQGTLQGMFELQSMVCELTAMEVANAGMYDGASALAEACLMACNVTGRHRIALLDSVNPSYAAVVRTYARGRGLAVDMVSEGDLSQEHACLAVQHPNFFGHLEDVWVREKAAHAAGALLIAVTDPISLGLLTPPGDYGADIAVAEGQSLGWPVSFGGPLLGLFACRQQYLRQMPGRIVGRTTDADGRTGYVLTLQTREQHIRRERATSNICTSQQLVGLAAAVYLAAVGRHGLRQVAETCYHKSHYAAQRIAALPGFSLAFQAPFFKEFTVRCPKSPAEFLARLLEQGIVGGLDVSAVPAGRQERVENGLLVCVTEVNTREEIDRLAEALAASG